MSNVIYFVGKPYPHTKALHTVRKFGYQAGLLLDKNIRVDTQEYDRVVTLDFSSKEHLLAGLDHAELNTAGLVCTYENYIIPRSWIAEHLGLPAPSAECADKCTDKYAMRQAFLNADASITPRFALAASEEELLIAARTLSYPLILKPTNLVKSLLVMRCNSEAELRDNFARAQRQIKYLYNKHRIYGRDPRFIVEEYVTGKTCSIAAFVDAAGTPHFCDGVTALTNAQDIGVNDSYIYARQLPGQYGEEFKQKLFAVARKGIAALSMRSTPAHVELIYNDREVKLIEIGARIGGYRPRMYEYSYGIDLIEQEIRLALGKPPQLAGTFRQYCSVFELFPKTEGAFVRIDGLTDHTPYDYVSIKAKPGDTVGPAKDGHKACAIIAVAESSLSNLSRHRADIDKMHVITEAK